MMRRGQWGLIFIGFVILTLLAACGGASSDAPALPTTAPLLQTAATEVPTDSPPTTVPTPQPTPPQPVQIRFVHAAANSPTLTILYDQSAIATNLSFGGYSEPVSIPGGVVTLRVIPSGGSSNTEPLLTINTTLPEYENAMVILTQDSSGITFFTLQEVVVPVDTDESSIRIVQAASSSPVTIVSGETTLAAAVNMEEASAPQSVPAGDTVLTFTNEEATLLDYPLMLREQQAYTLVLIQQGSSFSVIPVIAPAPGRTNARVINASPAYDAIDVYLDGALLAGNTGSYRASARTVITSGQHQAAVYPGGVDTSTGVPLISETLFLERGDVSLFLLGSGGEPRLLVAMDNLAPTPPDSANLAFVNTLENVPSLVSETIPLASPVDYGQPPVTTQLSAGSFDFSWTGINSDGIGVSAELIQGATLEAGRSYLYLITGRSDNQAIILSEAVGVDTQLPSGDEGDILTAPARLRFINVADTPVDFLINELAVVSDLGSRQGSALVTTSQRAPVIVAQENGGGLNLAEEGWELASDQAYTIILYGPDRDNLSLLFVPDDGLILDNQSPRLRLINLSGESRSRLGIGYSAAGTMVDTGTPSPGIPDSIRRLSIDAVNGTSSASILMSSGTFDLSVLDLNQGRLLTTVSSVQLGPGQHYDLIAYQYPDSALGYAFMVVYPASD
ncbi:MAG: DUF4397 domain-containing protein [Anaerolineaceae bacterium]|nr:DUF4397 domain-containing protein [Anaerolineaceae bacterium]